MGGLGAYLQEKLEFYMLRDEIWYLFWPDLEVEYLICFQQGYILHGYTPVSYIAKLCLFNIIHNRFLKCLSSF